jgi:predicted kinase
VRQFLLQMAGDSGTGKSTLARAIGRETGAVVLDKDVYKGWMLDDGLGEAANGQAYVALHATASMLLEQSLSVVLDNTAYFPRIRDRGAELAGSSGAAYRIIECICSDACEQENRLQTRSHREFQPGSLVEARAMAVRPGVVALAELHLTIDTTRSLDACVAAAVAYIEGDLS